MIVDAEGRWMVPVAEEGRVVLGFIEDDHIRAYTLEELLDDPAKMAAAEAMES